MLKINKFITIAAVIVVALSCSLNKSTAKQDNTQSINANVSCVAFYNLENLFDTIDQPNRDEEYLPNGANKWNTRKYTSKLRHMAQAISVIGKTHSSVGAVILGVSEVENRGVLEDLVKEPAIADRHYEIVHYDSPDRRGIDVGLLYNPRYFTVSSSKSFFLGKQFLNETQYSDAPDSTFLTRDQLLVSGYLQNEKIHIIVNHWPSRTGGEKQSEPLRIAAAKLTRSIVDSLLKTDSQARIIVMGDLNDDPFNESCSKIMNAKKDKNEVAPDQLYNVFWKTHESGTGSLVYNNRWNLFDQIMLSHQLLGSDNDKLRFWKSEIVREDFLFQQEGAYKGTPLRTHAGGAWLDGYSDHLPTLVYLIKQKK